MQPVLKYFHQISYGYGLVIGTYLRSIKPPSKMLQLLLNREKRSLYLIDQLWILISGQARFPGNVARDDFQKPYPCFKCNRSYTNKSTLNRHLREECGKMPQYLCRYCPKAFKQRSNFQRHIWTVHRCIM